MGQDCVEIAQNNNTNKMIKRSGVIFDENSGKFSIDWRGTHSYIIATLQLDAVLEAIKYAKGRLLDVGCGNKPFLHMFEKKINNYVGIEMPSTRHINREIDVFASGQNIPFKSSVFDTILTTSVLEHVQQPQKMFDEMHRVLRKGSYLILTTPCQYGLHEQPYDFFRYTKYSLRMMAEKSGFKVVEIRPIGGMLVIVNQLIAKYINIFLHMILEKIKGHKIDRKEGFKNIKRNNVVQFITFLPQKLFLILYKLGLRKIDNLSAEVDPCMYMLIARK